MPENQQQKQDIVALIKEYIQTRVEIIKLSAVERLTGIAANLITEVVVIITMTLTLLFGSIALGAYFGEELGSYAKGFGIVTLIYLALGLIVIFFKNRYIEKFLIDFMVKRIFQKKK